MNNTQIPLVAEPTVGAGKDPWLNPRHLMPLVMIGITQTTATVAIMLAVEQVFAAVMQNARPGSGAVVVLLVATCAVLWLGYREKVEKEALGQKVAHRARQDLTQHLVRLQTRSRPLPTGEIVLRFTGDLSTLKNWYANGIAALLIGVPLILGVSIALAFIDLRMAIALLAVIVIALIGQTLLAPPMRDAARAARRRRSRLAVQVAESANAITSIQAFGRSGPSTRKLTRQSVALGTAMIARARWAALMRLTSEGAATVLPVVIALLWSLGGGLSAQAGAATLAISGLVAPKIRSLGRARETYELAQISRERISVFLATRTVSDRPKAKRIARKRGDLKLSGISLRGVFGPINAAATAGSRVALMGPNGTGKSRLLGLVAGLEEPTGGKIVIDGQDACRRQLASRRKLVSLAAPTMAPLIRGTVAQNVFFGARVTEDETKGILDLCDYDNLLAELPKGESTRLRSGGQGLSQGQTARVCLMRALMRRPVILLLDEIDANLDDTGQAVLDRVFEAFEGTIVMASHTPRWQRRCDLVWNLADGHLATRTTLERSANHV